MESLPVIIIAGTVFGYALIARVLDKTVITGSVLFAAIGLAIGPAALGLVVVTLDSAAVHLLIEGALVLILFTDASHIRFEAPPTSLTTAPITSRSGGVGACSGVTSIRAVSMRLHISYPSSEPCFEGVSSVGRAADSKSAGRGFEASTPCKNVRFQQFVSMMDRHG